MRSSRGNRSSRPKVISPEVMSPETRVMSPEIYSHVARYLESCRPKFQNAQKDSKNARVKCEAQVVRFAVVFTEIANLTKLTKKPNISYSMVLTVVVLYVEAVYFERRSTSRSISLRLELWKMPPS